MNWLGSLISLECFWVDKFIFPPFPSRNRALRMWKGHSFASGWRIISRHACMCVACACDGRGRSCYRFSALQAQAWCLDYPPLPFFLHKYHSCILTERTATKRELMLRYVVIEKTKNVIRPLIYTYRERGVSKTLQVVTKTYLSGQATRDWSEPGGGIYCRWDSRIHCFESNWGWWWWQWHWVRMVTVKGETMVLHWWNGRWWSAGASLEREAAWPIVRKKNWSQSNLDFSSKPFPHPTKTLTSTTLVPRSYMLLSDHTSNQNKDLFFFLSHENWSIWLMNRKNHFHVSMSSSTPKG